MRKVQAQDQIKTSIDENSGVRVNFGQWNDKTEDFTALTEETKEELAKKLNVSVEFLDCMMMFAADISDRFAYINKDLKDLGAKVL
mgnify:CR=1 FL=1